MLNYIKGYDGIETPLDFQKVRTQYYCASSFGFLCGCLLNLYSEPPPFRIST